MRLVFLGTSAAMPSAARSHVSFVLWAPRPILVECGPTAPWQLERAGLDHREIDDVFISHIHGDHSLGLPMLLMLGILEGRERPLRLYSPASAVESLKGIFSACYPSQEKVLAERVAWRGLPEDGLAGHHLEQGVRLTAAPGVHGVPDLAYRFDSGGLSVVYSGDTAPAPTVMELARGADLLLHDATWSESIDGSTSPDHSSCRQAGRIAAQAGVRRLGLVHLHKRYLGREAELQAEAAESFAGEVFVPSDGDQREV